MSQQVLENPTDRSPVRAQRGRGMGAMFLGFFGSWWMAIGLTAVYGSRLAVFAAIAVVGLTLVLVGWRRSRADEPASADLLSDAQVEARIGRVFRNINIAQWGLIIALLITLNVVHRVEWIAPGIMLIVGLHFFPLAKLFNTRLHTVTGTALVALACTYPFLSEAGPGSPVGPIGAGLILWLVAAFMLADGARR
jgi:hypothetical protein